MSPAQPTDTDDTDRRDRPFADPDAPHRVVVHGHGPLLASLLSSVAAGRGAHAWLISGPPAVGKRTVARLLAQALACEAPAHGVPCGRCRRCRMVRDGTAPDLHVLPAPLRIESVRDLHRLLSLAPAEARHRIVLVPDVEQASPGAVNALLKTLEEPPPHAVLVLTSSAPGSVLATVRSRCRVVALRPLPATVVASALRDGWGVDAERAELLAALSAGRLGWAVHAAEDPSALVDRDEWLGVLSELLAGGRADRLRQAGVLAARAERLPPMLEAWQGWWRDVLVLAHGLGTIVNRDRRDELERAATRYGPPQAVGALRAIEVALGRLAGNANPRLVADVLALDLP